MIKREPVEKGRISRRSRRLTQVDSNEGRREGDKFEKSEGGYGKKNA